MLYLIIEGDGRRTRIGRSWPAASGVDLVPSISSELFESAPDPIVVVSEDGRIALVNRQTEEMFGYRRDELIGSPIEILVPERALGVHVAHREGYVREARLRPMGSGLALSARRKDGSEIPVEISLSPVEAIG